MSLREEMWKYEQITGESAEHVPIIKLGAFLDGYEMAIKTLKQESSEDCISRETVLEWLKEKDIIKTKNQEENARRELAGLPSVTLKAESKKMGDMTCKEMNEWAKTFYDGLMNGLNGSEE